jgi:phosphopantothenoylcysteine decarboxylase / phosphopantothenate---cysteine ligase
MDLRGKHIVLGLTGGIACYKSAELVRLLTKAGATVQVAMTEAATHFITPVTMQALSGRPVFLSQWDARVDNNMAHIDLSREADAILIAPASTDFLAKVANGLCDDLLTTLCIARECPLLVAPAMNRQMWAAAPTQRNAAQLRADGVTILGPGTGDQACGEIGDGRMLEPEELVEDLIAFFQPKPLQGKRVLITAGPTFEAIDPVRGITNLSSGKMGFSIARAAREAGADVLLVAGPTSLPTPRGVARTDIRSAQQMHDAVMAQLRDVDVFVAVAAVAARADAPYCVGFAAESENLEQYGEQKRQRKGVPLLVGNIGHHTFGLDDNEIVLFDAKGMTRLPRADKLSLARELVAAIGQRLPRKSV